MRVRRAPDTRRFFVRHVERFEKAVVTSPVMRNWSVLGAALIWAGSNLVAASSSAQQDAGDAQADVERTGDVEPTEEAADEEEARRRDERARRHFRAGEAYFEQERYPEAAREFRESFELSGRVLLLLNMATAFERALEFDAAREALERYLELEPEVEARDSIQARIRHLERMAQSARAGTQEPSSTSSETLGAIGVTGIAAMGLAVVAGVISVATGVAAEDIYLDLEARCGAGGACAQPGIQGRIDEGATLALTSTVTAFVGVGALAIGLGLFLWDLLDGESGAADTGAVRPGVLVGPELAGLALEGAW